MKNNTNSGGLGFSLVENSLLHSIALFVLLLTQQLSFGQSFILDRDSTCAGTVISVTNTTPGEQPDDWVWTLIEIPSGEIISIFVNEHWLGINLNIFSAGTYEVCLRIGTLSSNQKTCKTITGLGLPTPNFSLNSSGSVCIGDQIQFTDQSIPADAPIVYWYWELEEALEPTSEVQNPIFTFGEFATSGCKDLTLFVRDQNGCGSMGVESIFRDEICLSKFEGDFVFHPDSVCVGDTITFRHDTRGIGETTKYIWTFPDGTDTLAPWENDIKRIVSKEGVFIPSLEISNLSGCSLLIEGDLLRVSAIQTFAKQDETVVVGEGSVLFQDSTYDGLTGNNAGDRITDFLWTINGISVNNSSVYSHFFGPNDIGLNEIIRKTTSLFGCIDRDTLYVEVFAALLISSSKILDAQFFPNPASSYLKLSDNIEQFSIGEIHDINGKLISEIKISTNYVDITSLENGQYFLLLKGKEKTYVARFVKVSE